MIGMSNSGLGAGGSMSPNAAVLHVQAPVGSTITFSKNNVVVKVLDASKSHVNADDPNVADWYYAVGSSNYGTWTVTATLGTDNDSKTVTVSNNVQYDVSLSYAFWIHKVGEGLAQGFTASSPKTFVSDANAITTNYGSDVNGVIINPAISLADYRHCVFEYTKQRDGYTGSGDTNSGRFGFTSQNQAPEAGAINWVAYVKPDPTGYDVWQTATIDISQLSSSLYFVFCCWNNQYTGIRNLRLTKN